MNKIAITTGYMGSGSSAVTDLLSEFSDFEINNNSFEYILMHCPDGLFDLEDKLLRGNNVVRSDEAIHKFIECVDTLYDTKNFWPGMYKKRVSVQFKAITQKFVDDLTDFKPDDSVYWYFQQIPDSFRLQFANYAKRFLRKISKKLVKKNETLKYRGMRIAYPTSDGFYCVARKFLNDFFCLLGYDKHNLLLDQFLLPHNLYRLNNYFDDNVRVIVVDRDPRDVFVLNKYIWHKKGCPVAYPIDVNQFCKFYRKMRSAEISIEDKKILRVHFEDLVYYYNESLGLIMDFVGIDIRNHRHIKAFFNPEVSISNTQVYEKVLEAQEEIKIIERELGEYTYCFPYKINIDTEGCF